MEKKEEKKVKKEVKKIKLYHPRKGYYYEEVKK